MRGIHMPSSAEALNIEDRKMNMDSSRFIRDEDKSLRNLMGSESVKENSGLPAGAALSPSGETLSPEGKPLLP
jgi:hypothetical protein